MFDFSGLQQKISTIWTGLAYLAVFIAVVILIVVLIAAWRVRRHLRKTKQIAQEDYRRTHDADGRPLPPTHRGICDNCAAAHEAVYHLSSGARLCPDCYAALNRDAQPATP